MKKYYVIVDAEDREVNFYDSTFPNAKNRAIQSAKQVDDSIILERTVTNGTKSDSIIWRSNPQ